MDSILLPQDLIFVIGSPGAGKGPMCEELAHRWGWVHISVGDEVREYCSNHEQDNDDIVVQHKRKSELVPVEELAQVLNHRIQDCKNAGYSSFIIDGFPRDVNQIQYIQENVGVPGRVLFMKCSKEVARERVLTRDYSERADTDTVEIFEKRLAEFDSKNPDIVAHFEAEGKLVKINASDMDTDSSFDRVVKATEELLDALDHRPRLRIPAR